MVWTRSVDCLGYPNPVVFENTNCYGFDAKPCNGPQKNYDDFVANVSQAQRNDFYMTRTRFPGNSDEIDITSIYPWKRDIVATSTWCKPLPNPNFDPSWWNRYGNNNTFLLGSTPNCSYKDLCTSPNGVPVEGVTSLGVKLYKSPINGLPPYNDQKCYDCYVNGQNCGNCQGQYPPLP